MKGIYLASFKAYHPNYNIVYQDINGKRDIAGDMMTIDLDEYDFIIASPPCNYWSIANYRRNESLYSLNTKHLLPGILKKLCDLGKPFIVENVRNESLMLKNGVFNFPCFVYVVGRHIYFSNIFLCLGGIVQNDEYITKLSTSNRQGGKHVHDIIEIFLETVHNSL